MGDSLDRAMQDRIGRHPFHVSSRMNSVAHRSHCDSKSLYLCNYQAFVFYTLVSNYLKALRLQASMPRRFVLQKYHTRGKLARLLAGCLSFFVAGPAFGVDHLVRLDLETALERAIGSSPAVQAAETDLKIAETELSRAHTARILPKFDLSWILGPSPEARGNALTGDTDLGNLSLFSRSEVSLVQPLFTFGKLSAIEDAASGGIAAQKAGLERSQHKVALQVINAYYGLLLGNELWELAVEAKRDIGDARETILEKLEAEEGDYTYIDLARLDRFLFDVHENLNKVAKLKSLSRSALKSLLGLARNDSLVLTQERLSPILVELLPLEDYVVRSDDRPGLRQLRSVIGIREAQVRVARSDYYPQLFLGGQFKYSFAPNRDDQDSPFAKDDFNFKHLGVVVGLRQSLSFGATRAKVRKVQLEHQKLIHQERLARAGARIELERIYASLKEAQGNVAEARKAKRATRRWINSAREGFNAGLEESGELIEAVKEYGVIRAKYLEAVYNLNTTWAALQIATGNAIVK